MRCVICAIEIRAHAHVDRARALGSVNPRNDSSGVTGSGRYVRLGEDRVRQMEGSQMRPVHTLPMTMAISR
jgi:hypothetical protein